MASEIPATTPTRLIIRTVVGGIKRVVHLNEYSSPNSSSSSVAFDVTVKLVSIPAKILRRPWTTAKRCAEMPPMTQNCSFLHHSSILTPLHLSSRMPVVKIEINRAMKKRLAKVLIWIVQRISLLAKNEEPLSSSFWTYGKFRMNMLPLAWWIYLWASRWLVRHSKLEAVWR